MLPLCHSTTLWTGHQTALLCEFVSTAVFVGACRCVSERTLCLYRWEVDSTECPCKEAGWRWCYSQARSLWDGEEIIMLQQQDVAIAFLPVEACTVNKPGEMEIPWGCWLVLREWVHIYGWPAIMGAQVTVYDMDSHECVISPVALLYFCRVQNSLGTFVSGLHPLHLRYPHTVLWHFWMGIRKSVQS